MKHDILICVHELDINHLFKVALKACIKNYGPLNDIYIVTNNVLFAKEQILDIDRGNVNIIILDDKEVLSEQMYCMPGWYRQQMIKLHADRICKSEYICCLSADTILLKKIDLNALFHKCKPILYFNRYRHYRLRATVHLEYERKRLESIASILKIEPQRTSLLADFILDLVLFQRDVLVKLRSYLEGVYGKEPFTKIINNNGETLNDRRNFGEWTLYACFLLDVLKENVPIKFSNNTNFFEQVHNDFDLLHLTFDSSIVHFVNKKHSLVNIRDRLKQLNIKTNLGELFNV